MLYYTIQCKLLNDITLGQSSTDDINLTVQITGFCVVT